MIEALIHPALAQTQQSDDRHIQHEAQQSVVSDLAIVITAAAIAADVAAVVADAATVAAAFVGIA